MDDHKLAHALFAPRSIALVGASGDTAKNTSRPQRYLRNHGYAGKIFPVNPGRDELFGERAFPDIASIPEAVDHAFIMVPVKAVAPAIEQCCAKHVPVVTIFTDGFAETGEVGRRRQQELTAMARAGGVRIVGPNCIGLLSLHDRFVLTVNAVLEQLRVAAGPIAIISQSGSMMGSLMSRAHGRGIGFSRLVSVGNESDLSVGEITEMLVDDPCTEVILLFLETIRDADRLSVAAHRAYAAGKSIVVYKLGRSDVGRDLAASHTGAMTGSDESADAFFRAHAMLRVDQLETLFELPALVRGRKPASRYRVAVMTTTGGGAAAVVDRLGACGVEVVAPSDSVIANLAARNIAINSARITDLTLAGAKKEIYGALLNALLASEHCDLVLAIAGSSAQFQPQIVVEPMVEAEPKTKPLAVFLAPQADAALDLLNKAGVAGFRTPEACADAIRAWCNWRAPIAQPARASQQVDAATSVLASAPKPVNEHDACRVFATLGVACAATEIIKAPDQPVSIGFPVVAKVLSADIAHKTDAQAVRLNLQSPAELAAAYKEILANARAYKSGVRIEGVLVQRMERGLAEVILGFKRDPQVGPIVVLGVGGVLAEIYRDFALRLAPVDVATASEMVEQVKGLAVIRGYRGLPRGDCTALAQAVSAFSQLAYLTDVAEAEINPLLVKREGEGVVAVDGLLALCK